MSELNRDELKERFCALRDDALLREGLLGVGDLRPEAQEVLAEALGDRFGPYRDLAVRDVERAGKLFGRIQPVRGFARLRGPGEPVLGGRDVPPYDGILFLATGGLGFIPTSAPPEDAFRDFAAEAFEGPLAAWLGPEGTAWPEGVPRTSHRPLPLPLRARIDDGAAWIDVADIERVGRQKREERVYVSGSGDAVFQLQEAGQRDVLTKWAVHVEVVCE